MRQTNLLWFYVRIGLLLVQMPYGAWLAKTMPGDFSKPSWRFFGAMTLLCAVAVVFVLGVQKTNPLANSLGDKPSWMKNPFSYRQPLSTFDFGSHMFLATSLGCLVYSFTDSSPNWAWTLFLAIGCGMWFGTRASIIFFR